MILPMLIVPRGKGLYQFRFVLQLQRRSIDHKHGPLQSFPALLHLRLELFDYALTHLACYQLRQFLSSLAISTRRAGPLIVGPSFAVNYQIPSSTVDEILHRRRQAPIPLKPLPDHQPHYYSDAVDSLAELITMLLTQFLKEGRRRGLLIQSQ